MNKNDYEGVVDQMHLTDGSIWPMPITLDVPEKFAHTITPGTSINLIYGTQYIAELTVSDIWQPNKQKEAQQVYCYQHKKLYLQLFRSLGPGCNLQSGQTHYFNRTLQLTQIIPENIKTKRKKSHTIFMNIIFLWTFHRLQVHYFYHKELIG